MLRTRGPGAGAPLSVLVVDDQPSMRHLLSLWIEADDRLTLAGTAGDGREAVRKAVAACPDAVICDMEMPVMNGVEALPLLRRACPDTVIVMYTSDRDLAREAARLGADAVYDKTTSPAEVLDRLVELSRRR
jgi:two-component system chemotaxis response regulator CheB